MAVEAMPIKVDRDRIVSVLQSAHERLEVTDGELILDFSSVARVDVGAVCELERLAGIADEKGTNVILRGVNVDIYRVLKLARLTPRFSFVP